MIVYRKCEYIYIYIYHNSRGKVIIPQYGCWEQVSFVKKTGSRLKTEINKQKKQKKQKEKRKKEIITIKLQTKNQSNNQSINHHKLLHEIRLKNKNIR